MPEPYIPCLPCIHALCPVCRTGRAPQYSAAAGQGLAAPGWFHSSAVVPGALIRCPASALWAQGAPPPPPPSKAQEAKAP